MIALARNRYTSAFLIVLSIGALLLSGCGAPRPGAGGPPRGPGGPPQQGQGMPTLTPSGSSSSSNSGNTSSGGAVSLTALPLGDGHVGSSAQVGYVYSCQTSFSGKGGSMVNGPWITGSTWNATAKLSVQGAVTWPQANYSVKVVGNQRIITTNDLPEKFTTGIFPIRSSDPAYAYDHNPNTITAQQITYTLPTNPTVATSPSCLNMGPIGVLSDGVALFNALDAGGRDAVAHEVLDSCGGHPQMNGMYHHHDIPPCLLATTKGTSTLVGYARDGFGIYVERDANGNMLTNADLDACHGRVSPILWDGHEVTMFHYVATEEYPYTIGCYMGTPVN